jgi:hypothetical protein
MLDEDPARNDSMGVSVGDLNGDGSLDIVFGRGRHTPIVNRVLLNDGSGHFVASNLGDVADRTFSAALADIDKDGDLDVIVSNDAPDRKLTYTNDGKGHFTLARTWGESSWPTRFVTVADMNLDGFPDIIAANAGASLPLPIYYPSFVCLNNGKGEFLWCQALPTESSAVLPVADFDGNGAPDVFAPHRDGGRSYVLWSDRSFATRLEYWQRTPFGERTGIGSETTRIRVAAAADFNNDSRPDLVFYDAESKATSVFLNDGRRSFRESVRVSTGTRVPNAIGIADLNKDGRADIVLGCIEARGSVLFNTGAGEAFAEVLWNDGKGVVQQIEFGDIDNDGWPDILAARGDAANGIWYNSASRTSRP